MKRQTDDACPVQDPILSDPRRAEHASDGDVSLNSGISNTLEVSTEERILETMEESLQGVSPRHIIQTELRVAEDIGSDIIPELDPEMERYATMLMMDVIDRDPDVYYMKKDGTLGSIWSTSNFAMEATNPQLSPTIRSPAAPPHPHVPYSYPHSHSQMGMRMKLRNTRVGLQTCVVIQWALCALQIPHPQWVNDSTDLQNLIIAVDWLTLIPLWAFTVLKLWCIWDQRMEWFE